MSLGGRSVFEDDKHIVTGGRKLRDIRIVDNGNALAVEIEQTDLRLLTLLIPAEEALQIGTRLMVSAAEATLMARVGTSSSGGWPAPIEWSGLNVSALWA